MTDDKFGDAKPGQVLWFGESCAHGIDATPPMTDDDSAEDLYWRLHALSKILEDSGRIDQGEYRDAYPTILDSMNFVRERIREAEVLRAERDHARARVDFSVKLLTGIHLLLYPAPVKMADGRTMVFRPKDPDPHEVLQELSDRIRALPDELAKE